MSSLLVSPGRAAPAIVRIICVLLLAGGIASAIPGLNAAEAVKKVFDLPRGEASVTLKQFTAQAGVQLLYTMDAVRGVISHPVAGRLTAREALIRMFAGTSLTVVQDQGNGALSLVKGARPEEAKRPPPNKRTSRGRSSPAAPGPRGEGRANSAAARGPGLADRIIRWPHFPLQVLGRERVLSG